MADVLFEESMASASINQCQSLSWACGRTSRKKLSSTTPSNEEALY
jgi:hypothetical protein